MDDQKKNGRVFGLSSKLLLFSFATVVVVIAAQSGFNLVSARSRIDDASRAAALELFQSYNDEIEIREQAAAALSISIADRPDVRELYLAGDREGLLDLLTPVFATLKNEYNIRHLYVEDTEGRVYVRVHNPEKFGDDVTYRRTAAAALALEETVAGVEIGPNRLGIRSVSPMRDAAGNLVGFAEVGLDYDQTFIDDLKVRNEADYRMWVSVTAAQPAGLGPNEDAIPAASSELFYYAGTEFSELNIDAEIYDRVFTSGVPETVFTAVNGEEITVLIAPMVGYGDRIIGVLEILSPRSEALAQLQQQQTIIIAAAAGLVLFGLIVLAFALNRIVLRPVRGLAAAAQQWFAGDLGAQVTISARDELGQLATTFNALTDQLDTAIRNQEQMINARTRDLQLAADVGQIIAQVRDEGELLQQAVDVIQEKFNLYHTQVYQVDDTQERLLLRAGTGVVGAQMVQREHALPLGPGSINGIAAAEKRPMIVENTTADLNFFPNTMLPRTRAEMAVPLILGTQVVGVLNMQSDAVGGLSQDNLPAFQTVANQLTIAIGNARLFAEVAAARAEVDAYVRRLTREGWDDYLNAIDREEFTGYTYDLRSVQPLSERVPVVSGEENELQVPLTIANEPVGVIHIAAGDERHWSNDDITLVSAVAQQVGQQIENLRQQAQTEKYRAEAEAAVQRLTRQAWRTQQELGKEAAAGFRYDLRQVQPLAESVDTEAAESTHTPMVRPLQVRGEAIGEVTISTTPSAQTDEIIDRVTAQLSSHLESLRLAQATERALAETQRRSEELAVVNEIAGSVAAQLDMDTLLESALNQIRRVLPMDSFTVALYNEARNTSRFLMVYDQTRGLRKNLAPTKLDSRHVSYRVIHSKKPEMILFSPEQVAAYKRSRPANNQDPIAASLIYVPMMRGAEVIGVMSILSNQFDAYTSADINLMSSIASYLATALQNAQLFSDIQRQSEKERVINIITQKIQSTLDVETALQTTVVELGKALEARYTQVELSPENAATATETAVRNGNGSS